MANHSYVHLSRKISVEEAERLLRKIVNTVLGPRAVVEATVDSSSGHISWNVSILGSELNQEEAREAMKAPNDPFGFVVWFHPVRAYWEFRHPMNNWEWWAQDKIQHEIAHALGVTTYEDDGSGNPLKVDPEARKSTYRAYITRKFKQPYSQDDQAWFDKLLARAPVGFRE